MSEQVRTKFLGDFGEYLLTWYLRSRFGITVGLVKQEGIDLICFDERGRLFPKGSTTVIAVRTRERREYNFYNYVNVKWEKIEEASRRWMSAEPYFAYVRIAPEKGLITCFLQAVSKAKTYGKYYYPKKAEPDSSSILFEMKFNEYTPSKDWKE